MKHVSNLQLIKNNFHYCVFLLSPPIMLQCSVAELLPAYQHFDQLVLSIALIMILMMR